MNASISNQHLCNFLDVNMTPSVSIYILNATVSALNILTGMMAVLGNFIILLALWRSPSLRSTSVTLLASLALCDLLIGFLAQPAFVAFKLAQNRQQFGLYCTAGLMAETSGWLLGSVSFSIIIFISLDRCLALQLHLRYQAIVTNRRIVFALACTCFFYSTLASLRLAVKNSYLFNIIVIFLLALGLAIITPVYIRIFQTTRHHQKRVFAEARSMRHVQTNFVINMAKLRKSAVSIAYIAVIFQVCYLPLFCVLVVNVVHYEGGKPEAAYTCAIAVVQMSSSVNPVLYCWRMKDIRRAVMRIFNHCLPQCRNTVGVEEAEKSVIIYRGGVVTRIKTAADISVPSSNIFQRRRLECTSS